MTLYAGCGNTFVLIDNRGGAFDSPIKESCGTADGLILVENSSVADVKMRYFNRDGIEAEMCGNGIRCLVRFLEDSGDKRKVFQIETMERTLRAENQGAMISVEMGNPTDIHWNQVIAIEGKKIAIHHLNTGVPHAITFENLNFDEIGKKIRHHPSFNPKGANANFAHILEDETLTLRTYERGVEKETLACGTGATAAALAAHYIYGLESPIAVRTKSKEILYISFSKKGDHFTDVTLTGPAVLV